MKFNDLFLFLEQEDDDQDIDPMPNWQPDDEDGIEGDEAPAPEEPEPEEPGPDDTEEPAQLRPPKPKKLSAKQQIKQRWLTERPGLSDMQMEEAIAFFNNRRNSLRVYKPYGFIDETTGRHYINNPEVTSIVQSFPEMIPVLENQSKMFDLKNYPWEVIDFYIEIITANDEVIVEENITPDMSLSTREQLELAKQKWTVPENKIVDENGVIIYRVESEQEAIAFGALQRVTRHLKQDEHRDSGALYWCITVPRDIKSEYNDDRRGNMWSSYRPYAAPYFVWDRNREDSDPLYCSVIQVTSQDHREGPYIFIDFKNHTKVRQQWDDIVERYPVLENKQDLFKHFGVTRKERVAIELDKVTMIPGHKYYFGKLSKSGQYAYVNSNRHVRNVDAFLTMKPKARKQYVKLTTKENNDLYSRFVCDDPNTPFGILDILRNETSPEDLYTFLDEIRLKRELQIPEGISAIRKVLLGTNWKRWFSDDKKGWMLLRPFSDTNRATRYGMVDINTGEFIKDFTYIKTTPQSFLRKYEQNGIVMRKVYILQRYTAVTGAGQEDPNEYFYFFFLKDNLNKGSENYLKGKYYNGPDGDAFIQRLLANGMLKRLPS